MSTDALIKRLAQQAEEAARQFAEAQEQQRKAVEEHRAAEKRKQESKKEVQRVLKERVDTMLQVGSFSPNLVQAYLRTLSKDDQEMTYTRMVAEMVSSDVYGLEFTAKLRNGRFTWNGEEFEASLAPGSKRRIDATEKLFDKFQEILGKPFNPSLRWFEKFLTDYRNDPEEFKARLTRTDTDKSGMTFSVYHKYIQRYFKNYEPSPINTGILTGEDMNYLHFLDLLV